MLCLPLTAQHNVIEPTYKTDYTFAIVVDSQTFEACKKEITAYRNAIENEGKATYILYDLWESPQQVRTALKDLYTNKNLEGAVFVGDIPIPMIRRAQHLTSAFKMDQEAYPMYDSSVPSDRFYDDFDLQFEFVAQDSIHSNYYYYNLRGDSPQRLTCDIYSGRIKPSLKGKEGYAQVKHYLNKVVAEKKAVNPLDCVVSYTGSGSYSNSLTAWKDETITLGEQIPNAFKSAEGARFYMFYMYPRDIKDIIIDELRRPNLDLMLFHEHGMPERQYLTHTAPGTSEKSYYETARLQVRQYLRGIERRSRMTRAEAQEELQKEYGLDSTWFHGIDDPEQIAADSLTDLRTGIVLEDIPEIAPNPRMVIFDACYNADFREDDFIANSYIFSEGKNIVCFGNSVNVLQDKSASDLIGMLSAGYSIGQWAMHINILESHIIGDPTFRFSASEQEIMPCIHESDTKYWLNVLDTDYPADIHSLALYKLFELEYPEMSSLLLETFLTSPFYTQRLQCMHLLAYYYDDNYATLLKHAANDPYEFIRRKAVYYMGRVGRNEFVPYIVELAMRDNMTERVAFNVTFSAHHLSFPVLRTAFKKAIDKADYLYDKEGYRAEVEEMLDRSERTLASCWNALVDKNAPSRTRDIYISMLRNNPFPLLAEDALVVLNDTSEPLDLRINVAEALGWYVRSMNRESIIHGCKRILAETPDLEPELTSEITKTINRLNAYMR
jgi:hypothetical protein